MKKIVSFMLTLAMVMSLGSVPVFAANKITSTDAGSNSVSKAVTVTYIPETEKAVITSISVEVDGQIYDRGTVTLTPNSGNVTITVEGNKFTNLNSDINKLLYADNLPVDVSTADGWAVEADKNTASKTFEVSTFQNCTTASEIKYSNDGGSTSTSSGVYIQYLRPVSVGITWGAMNFTYSNEQVDGSDKGWTCEAGANTVKVENNGTESITAGISYKQADGYTAISGTFDKNFATIAKDGNATFTLTLSGKPNAALSGANIGSVTVAITEVIPEAIDVASGSELKAALENGGKYKLVEDVVLDSGAELEVETTVELDLNGKRLDGTLPYIYGKLVISDSGKTGSVHALGREGEICTDGELVVNGGYFQWTVHLEYGGKMTVNGGQINKLKTEFNSTLTITGGTVTFESPFQYGVNITITGGTVNIDPTDYVDTENYTITDNGNDTWTVTKKQKN